MNTYFYFLNNNANFDIMKLTNFLELENTIEEKQITLLDRLNKIKNCKNPFKKHL